jgi:hypothetical protein
MIIIIIVLQNLNYMSGRNFDIRIFTRCTSSISSEQDQQSIFILVRDRKYIENISKIYFARIIPLVEELSVRPVGGLHHYEVWSLDQEGHCHHLQ